MFSYRSLAVSVLPRVGIEVVNFGENFCDEPTCPDDTCVGDTCGDPTCFEDTCAFHSCHEQTCPDATAPLSTCEGVSCDANSCGESCGESCQAPLSCDDESCFPADGSCPADSCLDGVSIPECPPDGTCLNTQDCDHTQVGCGDTCAGSNCGDSCAGSCGDSCIGSGCGDTCVDSGGCGGTNCGSETDDCVGDTVEECLDTAPCIGTQLIVVAPPDDAASGDLARLHRELHQLLSSSAG